MALELMHRFSLIQKVNEPNCCTLLELTNRYEDSRYQVVLKFKQRKDPFGFVISKSAI
jgi:hypothetical protein